MKKICLCLSALFAAVALQAKVTLPKMFSDNMVLQQQADVNLWGAAKENASVKITTSWNNKTAVVKADASGQWSTTLATPTAGGPYALTFNDGEITQIKNVLVGEVWICSGQSNMEMPMKGFKGQPIEGGYEDALHSNDAQLRLFTVKRNSSITPANDVTGSWQEAQPASVRDFSATAYYFGRELRQQLGVPVGLIVASWGGSSCESWMKEEWLKAFPDTKIPRTQEDVWSKNRAATVLFNGMLYPLIGYGMRGVIWYQGEDNIPRYKTYSAMLSNLIRGWRSEWNAGDFPFYYCQIAPYDYSLIKWKGSAYLREQQMKVETLVNNCRMAVLMDAGLEYGIHPRKKKAAGQRLAMLALSNTYGVKGLPDYAVYKEVTFKKDTAVVTFDRSPEWIYFEHGTTSDCFEIAGSDKVFYPAKAWIERNHLYLKSTKVAKPVAVRYAFKDWVEGDLMHDGLPVSSFRTDDWEE